MRKTLCLSVLSLAISSLVAADDKVVLLGGGYSLEGSQGQIELNLKWVQDILAKRNKDISVFYTDGAGDTPDVYLHKPVTDSAENLTPLSRVFGQYYANGLSYRNHQVEGVLSETTATVLEPKLADIFANTKPDDSMLLVYNGHGAPTPSGAEKVTLKLWNDTRMSAEEFHKLLEQMDPQTDFRYIFTQCYSGGFNRLIYADPIVGNKLAEANRCGFTAESSWRQSEGCSASVNMGDYRDYTTFFFAAISGSDRLGKPLLANPDRNDDGVTDMREAHLYTLEYAHSTDLSRSSSEDYLEQWRPWFLKWIPLGSTLPENEYAELARSVAANNGLPRENFVKAARRKAADYHSEYQSLTDKKYAGRAKAEAIAEGLRNQVTAKWPQLRTPYTLAYKQLLIEDIDTVQTWIVSQPNFDELSILQNAEEEYEKALLDLERNIAQIDKALRFRRLAFLHDWLYQYGDEKSTKDYESLVSCESSPL